MSEALDLTNVDCLNCSHRFRRQGTVKVVHQNDMCRKAKALRPEYSNRTFEGEYIISLINRSHWYDKSCNPKNCPSRFITERVKDNRMWVHMYFKGIEKEPVVIEENRHEIMVDAGWWVRKLFGLADKFHKWQDARAVKKAEKELDKQKAQLLRHIVKELPRNDY